MREMRVIPISVLDKNSIYELVNQHDVVFHLAAILGVKTTMEKSIELIETNFDGTRNILQAALKGKKKVVLHLLPKYMARANRLLRRRGWIVRGNF